MRSWLIRVVTALAAVLFGALPLAPVLATVSEGATYTYDLHGLYAATPHGTTERGPPVTRNNPITYDPNGLRTLGVLARSHTPTTPATYDYDDLARFVRTARGSHGAEGQPRRLNGDLCALLSVRSAAKSDGFLSSRLAMRNERGSIGLPGDTELQGAISRGARTTSSWDDIARRLQANHAISPELASQRLHALKQSNGLGGADNVVFDRTGNVFDPRSGDLLGSLTQGGAGGFR